MRDIKTVIERMVAVVDDTAMKSVLSSVLSSVPYTASEEQRTLWRRLTTVFNATLDHNNPTHHAAGRILVGAD